jgi:hypothetical protein
MYKIFKRKKPNKRKKYLEILQKLNLENTKKSAYDITKYGILIAQTPEEKQLIKKLIMKLEAYKYKKYVKPFDDEIKTTFNIFMDSLNV